MFRGVKWFVAGGVATVMLITGAYFKADLDRRQAEKLRVENERLVAEQTELLRIQRELAAEKVRLEAERKKLAEVIDRLNVERRVALIEVLEQHVDERGEAVQTVIRFSERSRAGEDLPPMTFGVEGDTPHFDALVIKFDDDYVAHGDQLRGQSVALFRRVYGETQTPRDGYWLGKPGDVPDVYRVDPNPSDFEQQLWSEFWTYASDPEKAAAAGVRVAQGEAVYAPMKPNEVWTLTLEADGGLNLKKSGEMPADSNAADGKSES